MKYIVHYNLDHHNFILRPLKNRKDIVMISLPVEVSSLCKMLIKIDHHLKLNVIPAYRYRKTAINVLKRVNEQDVIILFNITYPMDINWISKITQRHCLHVWTWNPVLPSFAPLYSKLRKRNAIFYTFDKRDAQVYSMKYLPQVFRKLDFVERTVLNDFIFIGLDKNRAEMLDNVAVSLERAGYKGVVKIVGTTKINKPKSKAFIGDVPSLTYEELIDAEHQSKVIIDIVQSNQTGLTLRVLEALFMGRKLITNNKSLINYPWYHSNNILILENATDSDICLFMKKEFVPIDKKYLSEHDINNWINNFKN